MTGEQGQAGKGSIGREEPGKGWALAGAAQAGLLCTRRSAQPRRPRHSQAQTPAAGQCLETVAVGIEDGDVVATTIGGRKPISGPRLPFAAAGDVLLHGWCRPAAHNISQDSRSRSRAGLGAKVSAQAHQERNKYKATACCHHPPPPSSSNATRSNATTRPHGRVPWGARPAALPTPQAH